MKKLFFTLALALGMVMTVSAQQSGLFGYGPAKGGYEDYSTNSTNRDGLLGLPSSHGNTNDVQAPLGMGTMLLLGMGAAYAMNKSRKNKKNHNAKFFLIAAIVMAGSTNLWADKYKKITSSSELVANAEYLLVSGTEAYSGVSSNIGQHATVTFDLNGDITSISTAHVLKLGGSSNAWTFYDETDKKYIAYTSTSTSSNNLLHQVSSNSDNGATWTLTVSTTAVKMQNNYNTGRWMRYNSDRFCCYYRSGNESTTGSAVTLYKKETFTVTATVNDAEMGSVSVGGTTITASPNTGYRVKSGDAGYDVTSGTATVSHTGTSNTLTVTPSTNCTVRVNFEAIPTHTITCVAYPDGCGTFDAVASLYEEGTTSITALAISGYKFTGWSVDDGDNGAELSSTSTNPTTLTMGTANVTVTATFETATTHAISYSVNGNVVKTINVVEDEAVDLSAPSSGIPACFEFRGWVIEANKIDTPTDDDPSANFVTSATSTQDITYYAVMAVKTASLPDTYEKLSSDSFDTNATYLIGAVQGGSGGDSSTMMYLSSYSSTDEDINWGTCTSTPSSAVTFKLSGTAGELVAKDNSGNYLTCISVKKFAMSSTSANVYLHTDGYIKTASDGNLLRYNHNDGNGGLRWYASGTGQQAYFYKVVKNSTYASYCTTAPNNVSIAGNMTVTTPITVPSGYTLTVGGTLTNSTAANLIIEDGGQLICNNDVKATVKKNITKASNWGAGEYVADKWYFVASPITAGHTAEAVATLAGTDFDLYYLDEANTYWRNFNKAEGQFAINHNQGYLYASKNGTTLQFAGTVQANQEYVEIPLTKAGEGWNLVGNPFTFNAHVNRSYYKMNADGNGLTSVTAYNDNEIAPGTGIIVKADPSVGDAETVKFAQTAFTSNAPTNGNLQMTLAQTVTTRGESNVETLDNAIVSFNEDSKLGKFYFGTQDANIYIPQNGKEFAIVSAEAQGEMPVNFKANQNGQYTLTVNAEDVEMNYLHLIDNITGADVDMLAHPSYTFNAQSDDYESRFRLVFSAQNNNNDINAEMGDDFAFISNGQLIINGTGTLQVIDMLGRVMLTQELSTLNSKLSTLNFKSGVYVLRLTSNGESKTQKIVVK